MTRSFRLINPTVDGWATTMASWQGSLTVPRVERKPGSSLWGLFEARVNERFSGLSATDEDVLSPVVFDQLMLELYVPLVRRLCGRLDVPVGHCVNRRLQARDNRRKRRANKGGL
jgi:hypothetical protein